MPSNKCTGELARQKFVDFRQLRVATQRVDVGSEHGFVAARGRSGEACGAGVAVPVLDRGEGESDEIRAHVVEADALHQPLGDVQRCGHVVRTEHRRRVVQRLLLRCELRKSRPDRGRDELRGPPVISLEHEKRSDQIARLADRRKRLERVEREATPHGEHGPAGVEHERVGLGDPFRAGGNGPIAHGDEEQFRLGGEIGEILARRPEQLGDVTVGLVAQPDPGQRPADPLPRGAESPGSPAAAENA